jgi:hypothetical protein
VPAACSGDRTKSLAHTRRDSNPVDPPVREPETTEPICRDEPAITRSPRPKAIFDNTPRTMTQKVLDYWHIADVENSDALRSSQPETSASPGWTAPECSPILLRGLPLWIVRTASEHDRIEADAKGGSETRARCQVISAAQRSRHNHIVVLGVQGRISVPVTVSGGQLGRH